MTALILVGVAFLALRDVNRHGLRFRVPYCTSRSPDVWQYLCDRRRWHLGPCRADEHEWSVPWRARR